MIWGLEAASRTDRPNTWRVESPDGERAAFSVLRLSDCVFSGSVERHLARTGHVLKIDYSFDFALVREYSAWLANGKDERIITKIEGSRWYDQKVINKTDGRTVQNISGGSIHAFVAGAGSVERLEAAFKNFPHQPLSGALALEVPGNGRIRMDPRHRRIAASTFATLALLASVVPTLAAFPDRPITLIVPFAPGGPADTFARIIGEQMAKTLGQPIVLENVAGAGGATGTTRAAQSKPDGYTIMIGHMGTHGAAPAINPNLKYDPAKDFAPIGMIAGTAIVIIAKKDFPARKSEGICRVRAKEPDQAYRSARRHRLGGPHHLCLAAIDHGHQYSTRCLPRHGPVHGRPCCRAGRLWLRPDHQCSATSRGGHDQGVGDCHGGALTFASGHPDHCRGGTTRIPRSRRGRPCLHPGTRPRT